MRQVIGAYFSGDGTLELNFLAKSAKKSPFALVKIEGKVEVDVHGKEWTECVMELAYNGVYESALTLDYVADDSCSKM